MTWSDESSFTLFPSSGRVYVRRTPKEAYNPECLVPAVKYGEVLYWFGQYSVGSIINLHSPITAREYVDRLGNQVHAMIQTLFPNNDAVFQDDSASIHTAGTLLHGLKSMKANFSILPGRHNHQI
jgi:hypothetical protein